MPLGVARTVREAGRDVTIVALSRLVAEALAAADELAARGHRGRGDRPAHARPARPRDDRRAPSRARTGSSSRTRPSRTAASAPRSRRRSGSAAFDDLDAPIERVGAPFAPVPFSPPLEDAYLPGRADVAAAAARAAGRSRSARIPLDAFHGRFRVSRAMSILGNRVLRKEDPRFLRGQRQLRREPALEGALHVTFVRSLLAHARIDGIDASAAAELPGRAGLHRGRRRRRPVRAAAASPASTSGCAGRWSRGHGPLRRRHRRGRRRRGPRAGADAAELVDRRLRPAAGRRRPARGREGRRCCSSRTPARTSPHASGRPSATTALFDGCDVVVSGTLVSQRMAPCPLEPRSAAAVRGETAG